MRRRAPFVAVLLAGLVLAACGGGGGGSTASTAGTTAAPATTSAAPATSAAEPTTAPETTSGSTASTGTATEPNYASGSYRARRVAEFDRPVWVGSPPGDDRVFVVEQHDARIRILGQRAPFLTLPEPVSQGEEQGLLGLAFHPDFAKNGRYFVNFTDASGNTQVQEFHAGGQRPMKTWLEVDQPYPNHNGGNLVFGPDGRLYVGMGDGGSAGDPQNHAQDRSSLLGKLLAIDVDHGSGKPAIVAIGLRNPWRFSFAPDGKSIWIGDVGQDRWEEIDHTAFPLPSDANFGWRLLEGNHPYADGGAKPKGYIGPVFEYSHADGCSVTGGVELPGNAYLFGDYCSAKYWVIVNGQVRPAKLDIPAPVHFGLDSGGRLLVASGDGGVYLVTPEPGA